MTILTPGLAAKMLDVVARRQRDPQGMVYASTVLEAAQGAPDFVEVPNFVRVRRAQWHSTTPKQWYHLLDEPRTLHVRRDL